MTTEEIKEELVTVETAKLAKEKGFDLYSHLKNGLQPTQSLLQKWLREVHKIQINFAMYEFNKWIFGIQYIDFSDARYPLIAKQTEWDLNDYSSYEDALEQGLQEALKLI